MSTDHQSQTVYVNRINLELKAEDIFKATDAISAITRILEAFRAHNAGERPMDTDGINELAANGNITGGLSEGIEILSRSINARIYELLECGNKA